MKRNQQKVEEQLLTGRDSSNNGSQVAKQFTLEEIEILMKKRLSYEKLFLLHDKVRELQTDVRKLKDPSKYKRTFSTVSAPSARSPMMAKNNFLTAEEERAQVLDAISRLEGRIQKIEGKVIQN